MNKKLLFVSGTPRSGTSALVSLLNIHPSLLIGMERYHHHYKREGITPSFFERDRFSDVREEDTHPKGGFGRRDHEKLIKSYDAAQIIGDKYPLLYLHFDHILATFPEAKHVFIVRNPLSVAESYQQRFENPNDTFKNDFQKSVLQWNKGLDAMLALPKNIRQNFLVVEYESIFQNDAEVERLFTFLELSPPTSEILEPLRKRTEELGKSLVPRRDDIRAYVAKHAKWGQYRKLLSSFHDQK